MFLKEQCPGLRARQSHVNFKIVFIFLNVECKTYLQALLPLTRSPPVKTVIQWLCMFDLLGVWRRVKLVTQETITFSLLNVFFLFGMCCQVRYWSKAQNHNIFPPYPLILTFHSATFRQCTLIFHFYQYFSHVSHQQIYDAREMHLLEANWGLEKLRIFGDGGSLK